MRIRPATIIVCLVAIMLLNLHTLATGNGQSVSMAKKSITHVKQNSANKETKATKETVLETTEDTKVSNTEESVEADIEYVQETEETESVETTNSGEFLLTTDNVDYNYHSQPLYISGSERTELAYLIMGEAGGEGFEGCCLLAQCVRDAMVSRGYSTISEVISGMGYNGYKTETCEDVENAIDYVFIQGNSAVQHRILVMYASDLCEGEWHETQNFVYQHNAIRFFDMW